MAIEYSRKMLDRLMGTDRNDLEAKGGLKFNDPEVCKTFIARFCPHEMFQHTKMGRIVGDCPYKHHDDYLRDAYLGKEGDKYREKYEMELYEFLEDLVQELDKSMRKGRERLDFRSTDEVMQLVKELLVKIEDFGEQGMIDEAQNLTKEVDKIKLEIDRLRAIEDVNPYLKLEKRMQVCDVCGLLLVMNDDPKRMEAHIAGKQHVGFLKVRKTLQEFRDKYGPIRLRRSRITSMDNLNDDNPNSYRPSRQSHSRMVDHRDDQHRRSDTRRHEKRDDRYQDRRRDDRMSREGYSRRRRSRSPY
ncbi:LUC7-domain-containing protein [Rozella allomycis CSF55]|uniref:LUC7-domain-containing protein n=1 Tax=Rozella allomycis (strain CSF55) TaxID=988480 RepID=A0A075AT44_ROZAC|nr:LUC7-related domain-containing protein [Rozella allomycis CSF55]RKP20374.1 LUC7-domain-containing protein [Rozella allomycis CSF55]|eukprot:EPZ33451.1 LUC7-related domain-containing protein [Rozella allomycis CSF55]